MGPIPKIGEIHGARRLEINWLLRHHLEQQLGARNATDKIEAVMAVVSAELFAHRNRAHQ